MIPGQNLPAEGNLELNGGRQSASVTVTNTGDRQIIVGSHFHFFEVNKALSFDREKAYGMRVDAYAGAYTRFEPGDEVDVNLVAYTGNRIVYGGMEAVLDWVRAAVTERRWAPATSTARGTHDHHDHDHTH